ncbi:hypothetical protein VTK73DRAFT_5027 [Phialemonium thermophilum]|uniref:Disease resistance R13L4/SHOC-2-like LRR domain-containing protein n=1 Tax=Phialemonium thermophilum TaxID=223376 RepID=A0ABR3WQA5_9PEZI
MDRPRGLPENPAQARRAVIPAASSSSKPPVPPMPTFRDLSSTQAHSSTPLSPEQVISLAKEAMQAALKENETQAAETSGVSNDLRPGLTIDLSRKNIATLPDEVVDIIKNELERLALSHNHLQDFPTRFSECTSLRYLNVRQNKIKQFPLPLCDLKSLEILDLGRNRLRELPPDIVKLSSLKVFAIQKNMISELPLCLADMTSLQVLKLDGNPIIFPPPEVLQVQATTPPNEGFLKESEVTEVTVTAHIKRFLKQRAATMSGRSEGDATGDESSEGTETPRPPIKRVMSGRFPIKVPNGTDSPDLRSPNLSRPPPIPTRSHYRGLSQQNTRRPGVMPLTIGNVNERVRSNSETLLQASRAERSESRSRRMGIVSRKTSELGTLDETQANNRFSHYRGLSHGSAMQGPGSSIASKSPATPAEPFLQRPVYVRRLSILPERRRESKVFDPVLEAAKGILYSVFQIHPMIQMLLSLTNDGSSTKRSSLELVFYNTNAHVEELELEIQKHDPTTEQGQAQRENENVQSACITLVNAYTHVCSLLASNVDLFIDNGDPRYIRTLLTQLYNSIMELRVTCSRSSPDSSMGFLDGTGAVGDTIRPYNRGDYSVTPATDRLGVLSNTRARGGDILPNPSNLRVATDVPVPYVNGTGRTATITTAATPRSGESFASSTTSSGRGLAIDFSDEDRQFEKIFLSLQKSSELVMRTLPTFHIQLTESLRNAMAQRASEEMIGCWKALVSECNAVIQQTEVLKSRLSAIKLKEPGIRTQTSFWAVCNRFLVAWAKLGIQIMESTRTLPLPQDFRTRLRPIQQSIKETTNRIRASPWADFFPQQQGTGASSISSPDGSQSGLAPFPLPMTPQSAALGPAVQATVPSTPQSASFASAFSGNVFERADALISMGGLSMSRSGTMTSTSTTASLSSISSALSGQEGSMTSASMLSSGSNQGPLGPLPFRLNNGSKVAF